MGLNLEQEYLNRNLNHFGDHSADIAASALSTSHPARLGLNEGAPSFTPLRMAFGRREIRRHSAHREDNCCGTWGCRIVRNQFWQNIESMHTKTQAKLSIA